MRVVDLGEGATGELLLPLRIDARASAENFSQLQLQLRDAQANLTVDEQSLGAYLGANIQLPLGRHRVEVLVAGYLPFQAEVSLQAGNPYVLAPVLVPTPETRQAHDANVRLHRTLGLASVGAGAAIATAGVVLLALGSSRQSAAQRDLDAADAAVAAGQAGEGPAPCNRKQQGYVSERCVQPRDAAESRISRAKTEKVLGFIGIGAGAAMLGTGVVSLLTGESAQRFDPKSRTAAGSRARNWTLGAGPGAFGLAISGRF